MRTYLGMMMTMRLDTPSSMTQNVVGGGGGGAPSLPSGTVFDTDSNAPEFDTDNNQVTVSTD